MTEMFAHPARGWLLLSDVSMGDKHLSPICKSGPKIICTPKRQCYRPLLSAGTAESNGDGFKIVAPSGDEFANSRTQHRPKGRQKAMHAWLLENKLLHRCVLARQMLETFVMIGIVDEPNVEYQVGEGRSAVFVSERNHIDESFHESPLNVRQQTERAPKSYAT